MLLCLLIISELSGQFLFEGNAPKTYHGKTVHLDVIDGWNDFRLISEDQLLADIRIDSIGYYRFDGNGLPKGRGFYRLRFRDQDRYPPVSIQGLERHFIHFVARPDDTLRFANLTMVAPDATNSLIDQVAAQFDLLNEALLNAESDRLADLIEEKRGRFIREKRTNTDVAADLFLLGHWPGYFDTPLDLLEDAETLLLTDQSLRPEYLTTLRESIGSKSLDGNRQEIFTLRLLLGFALIGFFSLGLFFWRGRRSKMVKEEQSIPTLPPVELSPKEEEVLAEIVAGKSNKAIAAGLFISEATVKSHINSIYKKAGIRKRSEAVAFGQQRMGGGILNRK